VPAARAPYGGFDRRQCPSDDGVVARRIEMSLLVADGELRVAVQALVGSPVERDDLDSARSEAAR